MPILYTRLAHYGTGRASKAASTGILDSYLNYWLTGGASHGHTRARVVNHRRPKRVPPLSLKAEAITSRVDRAITTQSRFPVANGRLVYDAFNTCVETGSEGAAGEKARVKARGVEGGEWLLWRCLLLDVTGLGLLRVVVYLVYCVLFIFLLIFILLAEYLWRSKSGSFCILFIPLIICFL